MIYKRLYVVSCSIGSVGRNPSYHPTVEEALKKAKKLRGSIDSYRSLFFRRYIEHAEVSIRNEAGGLLAQWTLVSPSMWFASSLNAVSGLE